MQGTFVPRETKRLAAQRSGSCMALWKRADVRAALWAACRTNAYAAPCVSQASGPVRSSRVDKEQFAALLAARADEIRQFPLPREDLVRDAWVSLVHQRLGGEDVCFFTGSYRDDVGYPNGFMLARNVQRDWKRFVAAYGYDTRDWVVAVEKHPSGRDILHVHALLSGMSDTAMNELEHFWTESRGWSKAVRCHDGGVRYTCKYALKGGYTDTFDWSW